MHNHQCPCLRDIMPNYSSIKCDQHDEQYLNHHHHKNCNYNSNSSSSSSNNESRDYCSQDTLTTVNEWCCSRVPHPDQHPFSPSAATNNDRNDNNCHYHLQPNQINCNTCSNSSSNGSRSSSNNCCPSFVVNQRQQTTPTTTTATSPTTKRCRIRRTNCNGERGEMAIVSSSTAVTTHVTATVSKLSSSPGSWTLFKSVLSSIILLIALLPSFTLAGVPKLGTAYACEDKTLTIECEAGDIINIVRANFGRFSLTICNDHGNVDWSVNCMSQKSLRVLNTKCTHKQNCSVLASAALFSDPCPGTRKYLEAHYKCESAVQTTTITNRISPPPWQVTSQPSVWSTSTIRTPTTSRTSGSGIPSKESPPFDENYFNGVFRVTTQRYNLPTPVTDKSAAAAASSAGVGTNVAGKTKVPTQQTTNKVVQSTTIVSPANNNSGETDISSGVNGVNNSQDDAIKVGGSDTAVADDGRSTIASASGDDRTKLLLNNNSSPKNVDGTLMENHFCGPTMARNLFWNVTQAGDAKVQPCPGGATGIAKWRCIFTSINGSDHSPATMMALDSQSDSSNLSGNNGISGSNNGNNNTRAMWYPATPDLTQCRSLWLNSLEIRVNQRDSSLISIANDLSQVTSSKTLYGGDMLVTTKIVQIMSEKMSYDIETFPDQRQRETTVMELLHGVVKTGSNLLDQSQEASWHDLSFEDQMRVATSLLTGLEDNAFLLADTINREKNAVQKAKNILLSVRIMETRNIAGNEIFPDSDLEQWNVSNDRIEIPRAALIENSEGGLVRIVFVAFDRLESILRPATVWLDSKLTATTEAQATNGSLKNIPRRRILNSKVISASLGKGRHIQITEDIKLTLKHLIIENVTNPSCVFWSYIDHAWSSDGCRVIATNHTHTTCSCDHLTNFAILMDVVDDVPQSLLSMLENKMRVLIYISISVTVVLLIVAIITLKLFNGLLIKSCRTTIYRNLYICLLFIELLFLAGIEISEAHSLCLFPSAFLHCAFLSAVGWTFFEGYQLYLTLTNDDMLLEVEKTSRILWYYLFTYGLTFLIVAIALAIDPLVYTRADYCVWMEQTSVFYLTFIAPIIIFIVMNIAYTVMAINVMAKRYKTSLKNKEHTRLATARFYMRCSFFFLLIFTLNWLFAFLYMKNQKWKHLGESYAGESWTTTYGYLFIFFNTLQGVYIFIFHCIQNEKIRREYCKFVQHYTWLPSCLRCAQAANITSTSSNVQHQYVPGSGPDNVTPTIVPPQVGMPVVGPGGLIETATGTLSRAPKMGTQCRRLNYGMEAGLETGTLRGQIMPAQTSPMSSTGSTQLIYNGGSNARHLQEWDYQHPDAGMNKHAFDERLLYYDANAKALNKSRSQGNDLDDDIGAPRDAYHYTEGRNKKHRKPYQNNTMGGSNRNVYPYRKQSHPHEEQESHGHENGETSYLQNYRRYMQAEADAEFLNQHYQRQLAYQQQQQHQQHQQQQQQFPGTSVRQHLTPQQIAAQRYYQQHVNNYLEEPVYEEIVSSQMSSTYGDRMESDDDDIDPNATDEDESGSRSNKDDTSSRQSSSRPLIKSQGYNFDQSQPVTNGSPHATPSQRAAPQHPSRNLSAILDENNTVVCYLEPIAKKN